MNSPEAPPDARTAAPSSLAAHLRARHARLEGNALGVFYVSIGTFMLVIMAAITKHIGERLPAFEIFFFRSAIGFLFVLPVLRNDLLEPLRTKRFGMHFVRGSVGSCGNFCFFWTLTHMLLADSMALQFSRPLWTIPLALLFLGEWAGMRRGLITLLGFAGIMLYARPFTAGFDMNALVGAAGGFFGALVIICIKRLQTSEPTRVIMFYYAFWNAVLALIPTLYTWVTPLWWEWGLLVVIGFLGIGGQGLVTLGLEHGDATFLAPLDYSRIVYAAAIGYIVFGELPGLWSLAGMALIIVASIYLVLTEKKKR